MTAARRVAPERRDIFLQRVASMLKLRGRFDDSDLSDVCELASCGLIHARSDAA
jgi:hypothetical protein